MMSRNGKMLFGSLFVLSLFHRLSMPIQCQTISPVIDEPSPAISPASSLGLTPERAEQLNNSVAARDYATAERLLLEEIQRDPHSLRTAQLLDFAGNVYFLNSDYLSAAIAWKKSEAISPLQPSLRFSLAMAYIRIGHPDWAGSVLASLAAQQPKEALYPYWLGRLEYDAQHYADAIQNFQRAVTLSPAMARAYDNLGLCYYSQNENALAVDNFKKAIELDRGSQHRSPWPYLNLAVTLQSLNQLNEAEANLREALSIDPQLAAAHYRLGSVLEDLGRLDAAVVELRRASAFDGHYAEPHLALARIYKKLGKADAAHQEVQAYLKLHSNSSSNSSPATASKP
jgi:tetratricopeptide (TPR) repeat protein